MMPNLQAPQVATYMAQQRKLHCMLAATAPDHRYGSSKACSLKPYLFGRTTSAGVQKGEYVSCRAAADDRHIRP